MSNNIITGSFVVADVASQDLLIPDFGGAIPKAAMVLYRGGTANETHFAPLRNSIGFIDSTGVQGATGIGENDAVGNSDTASKQSFTAVILAPNPAGATVVEFTGQLIADGIRLTRLVGGGGGTVSLMLFGGDGVQAKVVAGHVMDTSVISSLPFQPNAHFNATAGLVDQNGQFQIHTGFGGAVTTGAENAERSMGYTARNNFNTSDTRAINSNTAFLIRPNAFGATPTWIASAHVYTSNGMTWTLVGTTSGHTANFLFLRVEDEQVGLVDFNYPTTTGVWTSGAYPFVPSAGLVVGVSVFQTYQNTELGTSVSAATFAMLNSASVSSIGFRSESGVATIQCGSNGSSARYQGLSWNDDAPNLYADTVGVNSNSWEMNVTTLTTPYGSVQWCLSFGGAGGGPADTVKQGANPVDAIFAGATPVDAMYQGVNQIF